jgi:hypothetical protein
LSGDEWMARLETTFEPEGTVSTEIADLAASEGSVGEKILYKNHRGHLLLMHSFLSFFIETLNCAARLIRERGWPEGAHYPVTLVQFHSLFQRFRATEILFESGYPLDAMAHIRDVKDRAFLLCAIAKNRLTFMEAFGAKEGLPLDENYGDVTRNSRMKVSRRISQEFIGKSSGLSREDQDQLERWDNIFHLEVHNGFLSFALQLQPLMDEGRVPEIGPTFNTHQYYAFTNRTAEMGWMLIRLFPYLQPESGSFGAEWNKKRFVLDDSFEFLIDAQGKNGNAASPAFTAMMQKKFKFKDTFCYGESMFEGQ